ncbi:hypothetical protein DCAR_0934857 [Daucus carota subsp. sativus]|uniref:protein-serine/threonine phosphatase n=1 Tax=Daucus carota subsp. sativus TaxID=79200 RepID=A0A175YFP5_DAUCS|nr:PREDICTED: probable protein phosphatase 2C 33 [Daucus carota subsp. sativus]WOH15320.1 hypothetical protein DCAR_0934857 [Daucus carota subsp. sativus]
MGSCLSTESRSPVPNSPGSRKRKNSRKKLGSRNSSFESKREEQLYRIPGRMFLNGSSDVASMFTQQGKKGTNQDAMIVWENFASRADTIFCGVFDGHGPYGHMVAKRVRDSLPLKLSANWEVNIKGDEALKEININGTGSMNSESTSFLASNEESRACLDVEGTENHENMFQILKDSFLKAYKVMDRELKMYTTIDCFCSGTTAVTLIKQGQDLVISNVGDSRAVMGTRDQDGHLTALQLTVDLKPNLPAEAERIRNCKGRVFALRDEPEVARVWLPNNDSPGLAMARAFGDFCLKDFGLISVPEVSHRHLTEKDEFVVLASDGIWDVLSNKEVVDIVAAAPARSYAARALVEAAVRAWKCKYPTSKVDDCAVVCLFLNSNDLSSASAVKSEEKIVSMGQQVLDDNIKGSSEPLGINRSGTVRNDREKLGDECKDEEVEADEDDALLYSDPGKDWSALEGVSRVNTLLTLPRFVPGEVDKAAAGAAKTLK